MITVYFSVKERTFVNIINTKIGIGDVLFFIACAFIFSLPNFILFFTFSLLASALIVALFQKSIGKQNIPLAGIMSVFLGLISLVGQWTPYDLTRSQEWWNTLLL